MATKSNTIGDRLKAVRVRLGYTQEQFSKVLLGKENKATISAYENGRLDIAEKAKVILFTTYGVNKDWLETGEGEMFTTTSEKAHNLAKETGKPHEKKPLREAIKQFILGDWLTYERNAKEIEEMAEIIKLLEQKKNDKNQ